MSADLRRATLSAAALAALAEYGATWTPPRGDASASRVADTAAAMIDRLICREPE